MKNRRSVWSINTEPFPEAHFAVFPRELVRPCILAGSRQGDLILDPFFGSGTVGEAAMDLHRRTVGIEMKPEFVEIARKRLGKEKQSILTFGGDGSDKTDEKKGAKSSGLKMPTLHEHGTTAFAAS